MVGFPVFCVSVHVLVRVRMRVRSRVCLCVSVCVCPVTDALPSFNPIEFGSVLLAEICSNRFGIVLGFNRLKSRSITQSSLRLKKRHLGTAVIEKSRICYSDNLTDSVKCNKSI